MTIHSVRDAAIKMLVLLPCMLAVTGGCANSVASRSAADPTAGATISLVRVARTAEEEATEPDPQTEYNLQMPTGFSLGGAAYGGHIGSFGVGLEPHSEPITLDVTGAPEDILRVVGQCATSDGCVFFHQVNFPRGKYHLVFHGATGALLPKVAEAYAQAFGVQVSREAREVDVLVLQADSRKTKELPVSKEPRGMSGASMGGYISEAIEGRFEDVALMLAHELDVPVVNEAHDEGCYSLVISWCIAMSPTYMRETLDESLADQRLKLVPGRRKVEAIHVDPIGEAARPKVVPTPPSANS
jgi:hypothetical protein